jgi:hypothetical protein
MGGTPKGVWVPVAFFVAGGLMDLTLTAYETPRPWPIVPLWEAVGRAAMHFLLALGLWRRIALCRSIAMVYCLAVVPTYIAALALAYADAPFQFPPSVVVQSLYQVPSCLLLFPFLRSEQAAALYPRPLL